MDASLQAVLNTAHANLKNTQAKEEKEREDFEDFMIDKILLGDPDLKLYLLRRDCENETRYADSHIDCLWWVWKSRAEIARGETAEAYPFNF
jgi:hypothetical protein